MIIKTKFNRSINNINGGIKMSNLKFYIICFVILAILPNKLFADWAALEIDEGLGQYYYLEADATTYIHWKTDWTGWSSAAVWLDMNGSDGFEYSSSWAHDGSGGGDGNKHLSTGNLSSGNHTSWGAGIYIDFYLKLDDATKASYDNRLQIIDITTTTTGIATSIVDNPTGSQNLVMNFKINAGSGSNEVLDRLWIQNISSTNPAQEGSDITSSGGVYLYWETVTGSETYNGDENSFNLNGDSGSATDETWGHNTLTDGSGGIDIPDSGLRCYIVIKDLAEGFTSTNNVNFAIINDGLSLNNGLMRINQTASGASDVSLPVELTSFTADNSRSGEVSLSWVTESEIENLGFTVERRIQTVEGPTEWIEIASYTTHSELQGQGSVTHRTEYSFIDQNVEIGKVYDYRLADVSYEGIKVYHTVTALGVEITEFPNKFYLHPAYPNPFNPKTTISYDVVKEGNFNITIYDISGKMVANIYDGYQIAGNHQMSWVPKDCSTGLYFCTITSGSQSHTQKLILLK